MRNVVRDGGKEGTRVSCYPGNAARWEKGHRMALSPGSSVSEDVWTLIKMCRASGRVPLLSPILSLSPPRLSRARVRSRDRDFRCMECHLDGSCRRRRSLRREESLHSSRTAVCRHFLPTTDRPTDRTNRQAALFRTRQHVVVLHDDSPGYYTLFAKTKRARGQRGTGWSRFRSLPGPRRPNQAR